jgi:hypothetical protein
MNTVVNPATRRDAHQAYIPCKSSYLCFTITVAQLSCVLKKSNHACVSSNLVLILACACEPRTDIQATADRKEGSDSYTAYPDCWFGVYVGYFGFWDNILISCATRVLAWQFDQGRFPGPVGEGRTPMLAGCTAGRHPRSKRRVTRSLLAADVLPYDT